MLRDDLAVVVCLHLSAIVIMTKVFTQDSHNHAFTLHIHSVNVVR